MAIAASCAIGASTLAAQNNEASQKNAKMDQKETWDSEPMVLRVIGYPVVFLERSGHTLIDSPEILSQTFKGERPILSKNGLFARRDMAPGPEAAKPGHRVASAPEGSIANRRD